jgi:hypothetical protein
MSGIQPGLLGGYSNDPAAQQEQCTVMLHYWPRVDAMRGCTAALDNDALLGENMCSSEAEDLINIQAGEDQQFPMRWVRWRVTSVWFVVVRYHVARFCGEWEQSGGWCLASM